MKKINLTLLAVLLLQLVLLKAQNSPIALDLEKHVDKFTGDLNYSIPLNSLKGPNGENFPFVLNYRSSIGVDQEASWVGLGWDLNIGEISRSVNGFPDDWRGGERIKEMDGLNNNLAVLVNYQMEKIYGYGPIYFKDFPNRNSVKKDECDIGEDQMDIMTSRENIQSNSDPSFYFPDYDNFYASAPGFGGEFKAYLFDYASLYVNEDGNTQNYTGFERFTKQAQFRFLGDGLSKVQTPYYNKNDYFDLTSELKGPIYNWPGVNSKEYFHDCVPTPNDVKTYTNPLDFSGDYNTANLSLEQQKQRVKGGKIIEYYTNQQINLHFVHLILQIK